MRVPYVSKKKNTLYKIMSFSNLFNFFLKLFLNTNNNFEIISPFNLIYFVV